MSPILGIYASQISGHLWEPTGAYDALFSTTLSASATSINISGIPSTYKHLQLRTSYVGTGTYNYMQINGDTAANYSFHQMWGEGSIVQAVAIANGTLIYLNNSSTNSSYPSVGIMDLLDYSNVNKYKTVRSIAGYDINSGGELYYRSASWRNTSAVTSLTITSSVTNGFAQYSSFALYGIK